MPLIDFVARKKVHLKVYQRVVAKHSTLQSLITQDLLFLTVFIVVVSLLRIPFTIT